MTTILYSAIYGGYDEPKPLPPGLDVPALMFTDTYETAAAATELGWIARVVPHGIVTRNGDPARVAPMLAHKYWKTHPSVAATWPYTEPATVALWIDGSIAIKHWDYGARCLAALGSDDMALTPHPWRDCAIAEGEYSATLARYHGTGVDRQTEFYARFHPRRWGLFATGAIAWRINQATHELGRFWWQECLTWSHQDQVSLPVLLRLAGAATPPMEGANVTWNRNLPWEQWWTLNHHAIPV